MQTIHASHNLTIEYSPEIWRLLNGTQAADGSGMPLALFEAQDDTIRCSPAFAQARRLPDDDGLLDPALIARVVVGWAPESQNWHLGLLLAAQPESNFKMRWCGLASWPSGAADETLDQAKLAGQSLARLIDRPLHVVPPPVREPVAQAMDTQSLQVTTPLMPLETPVPELQIDLKSPPFLFDDWVFQDTSKGYAWEHRARWRLALLLRTLGFAALSILFLILGIGTQTSGLAAVKPGWLPWVGIAVSGLLVVNTVVGFMGLLAANDIVIDTDKGELRRRARFLPWVRWRVPFDAVQYVLISQMPATPQGRKNKPGPVAILQDVWLHVYDGHSFRSIVKLGQVEGHCHSWELVRQRQKTRGRRPLNLNHYNTPAHHAAQFMAQAIHTDVWLDIR